MSQPLLIFAMYTVNYENVLFVIFSLSKKYSS